MSRPRDDHDLTRPDLDESDTDRAGENTERGWEPYTEPEEGRPAEEDQGDVEG
ncbi:hypothetical protein [Streptoalloteichus hindustanus]|uniref:Uncharacterized protein n=1 Tax=Streptoalloteichus hindustanus TaxID=2017 RepID=A0A1M5DMC6_STRHI|nr:hypothetical protein [Streptoalloteichus hindustanus]SHF68056.1 hypothetical protein SAMN05444320_104519 [Streptoalloteichus hindustanus]